VLINKHFAHHVLKPELKKLRILLIHSTFLRKPTYFIHMGFMHTWFKVLEICQSERVRTL